MIFATSYRARRPVRPAFGGDTPAALSQIAVAAAPICRRPVLLGSNLARLLRATYRPLRPAGCVEGQPFALLPRVLHPNNGYEQTINGHYPSVRRRTDLLFSQYSRPWFSTEGKSSYLLGEF